MDALVLLTLFVPFVGFLINGIFNRYIGKKAHWIAVPALGISALGGLAILWQVAGSGQVFENTFWTWIIADKLHVPFGYYIDNLAAIMVFVVTFVSFWIHLYSVGYMAEDRSYARYFAYLNFFVFAMLLLVMANNYVLMFVGWEGVGLASYLLIGFWFHKKSASDAANKAFIVNRIGDAGFLLGIFTLFALFGTLNYTDIFGSNLAVNKGLLSLALIFLFIGATGKSAQFPLYVWLPDAMEGPTPVSALIHAATMVTAGVYMVARSAPLFVQVPEAGYIVALTGAFTAVFAATMALVNNDIKRIIAYSTISQIGYMMVGVGLGAYWAGIFHLYTHAFFKALLFLGAGSVMHAMHDVLDINRMGGLKEKLPHTFWTFLIGSLALAGIFPFAGFWSKDAIIHYSELSGYSIIFYLTLTGVLLTAFYTFRLVFRVFFGEPRDRELYEKAHESPPVMLIPMWVLAFFAVVAGFVSGWFQHFLEAQLPHAHFEHTQAGITLPIITNGLALIGILIAYFMYVKPAVPSSLGENPIVKGIYKILYYRWGIISDWYEVVLMGWLRSLAAGVYRFFEDLFIDGTVVGSAGLTAATGNIVRKLQDGKYSTYALLMTAGFILILYLLVL